MDQFQPFCKTITEKKTKVQKKIALLIFFHDLTSKIKSYEQDKNLLGFYKKNDSLKTKGRNKL